MLKVQLDQDRDGGTLHLKEKKNISIKSEKEAFL